MGISKNLMLAYFPEDEDEEDDLTISCPPRRIRLRRNNAQADEPKIHQPGLVKNRNFLVEF